jgi:hypothetical protein
MSILDEKKVERGVGLNDLINALEKGEKVSVNIVHLNTIPNGTGQIVVRGVVFKNVLVFSYEGCCRSKAETAVIPIIRDLYNEHKNTKAIKTAKQMQELITCIGY